MGLPLDTRTLASRPSERDLKAVLEEWEPVARDLVAESERLQRKWSKEADRCDGVADMIERHLAVPPPDGVDETVADLQRAIADLRLKAKLHREEAQRHERTAKVNREALADYKAGRISARTGKRYGRQMRRLNRGHANATRRILQRPAPRRRPVPPLLPPSGAHRRTPSSSSSPTRGSRRCGSRAGPADDGDPEPAGSDPLDRQADTPEGDA